MVSILVRRRAVRKHIFPSLAGDRCHRREGARLQHGSGPSRGRRILLLSGAGVPVSLRLEGLETVAPRFFQRSALLAVVALAPAAGGARRYWKLARCAPLADA